MSVVVPNDGGQQSADVNSSNLGSGETVSHTVGPFTADAGGTLTVEAGSEFTDVHDDASTEITVGPRSIKTGESINTNGALQFTVTGVSYEQALIKRYPANWADAENELQTTDEGDVIVGLRIDVENTESSGIGTEVPTDAFTFETGSPITDFEPYTIDATDIRGETIPAGSSRSGMVLTAVSMDGLPEPTMRIQVVGDESPDAELTFTEPSGVPSSRSSTGICLRTSATAYKRRHSRLKTQEMGRSGV